VRRIDHIASFWTELLTSACQQSVAQFQTTTNKKIIV